MRHTRRAYLAATAGALTLGTAGCLGGGGSAGGGDALSAIDCEVPERDTVDSLPTPAIGPDDAAVTVDAWEDFACPHCATFTLDVVTKLESEYVSEGVVRFRHHDFPIPVDDWWSWRGASAAREVQNAASDEQFFSFVHTLMDNQSKFGGGDVEGSLTTLRDLANDAGLDGCGVAAAAARDRYRPFVESQRSVAVDDRGYQGTPTVLVNGTKVTPRWQDVKAAVEDAR